MDKKDEMKAKEHFYGEQAKRRGIPVEYYLLSAQQIEEWKAYKAANRTRLNQEARERALKKRIARQPGAYSIPQLGRHAVGHDHFDNFGDFDPE